MVFESFYCDFLSESLGHHNLRHWEERLLRDCLGGLLEYGLAAAGLGGVFRWLNPRWAARPLASLTSKSQKKSQSVFFHNLRAPRQRRQSPYGAPNTGRTRKRISALSFTLRRAQLAPWAPMISKPEAKNNQNLSKKR